MPTVHKQRQACSGWGGRYAPSNFLFRQKHLTRKCLLGPLRVAGSRGADSCRERDLWKMFLFFDSNSQSRQQESRMTRFASFLARLLKPSALTGFTQSLSCLPNLFASECMPANTREFNFFKTLSVPWLLFYLITVRTWL